MFRGENPTKFGIGSTFGFNSEGEYVVVHLGGNLVTVMQFAGFNLYTDESYHVKVQQRDHFSRSEFLKLVTPIFRDKYCRQSTADTILSATKINAKGWRVE